MIENCLKMLHLFFRLDLVRLLDTRLAIVSSLVICLKAQLLVPISTFQLHVSYSDHLIYLFAITISKHPEKNPKNTTTTTIQIGIDMNQWSCCSTPGTDKATIKPWMADVLLAWHLKFPVNAAEKAINDEIFTQYQMNRNPFVDHPEWAIKIWQ
jgi:hypothetical protein